jgi:hypothetical protein
VNFYILITIELPKTQKQKSRKGRVREGLWGRSFNLKGVRFHSTDTQPLLAGRFIIKPAIKDVNKYYSNALDSGLRRNDKISLFIKPAIKYTNCPSFRRRPESRVSKQRSSGFYLPE